MPKAHCLFVNPIKIDEDCDKIDSMPVPGCTADLRDLAELAYAQDPKKTEYILIKLGLRNILSSVEYFARNNGR